MFDDVVEWFKGLFGGAAEEAVQGAADPGETAQGYGETAFGEASEVAQGYGEAAFGEAGETVQGFQEQADAVGGFVEDPGGTVTDAARDRLTGEGS
ncbi:hypothetical protein [Nocardiopsis protaetiae]|uniref:hypothetical protein n=1 Tax=Nocardiopsis protaetiae TaxID=3382270 RepID=UPI00387AA057